MENLAPKSNVIYLEDMVAIRHRREIVESGMHYLNHVKPDSIVYVVGKKMNGDWFSVLEGCPAAYNLSCAIHVDHALQDNSRARFVPYTPSTFAAGIQELFQRAKKHFGYTQTTMAIGSRDQFDHILELWDQLEGVTPEIKDKVGAIGKQRADHKLIALRS